MGGMDDGAEVSMRSGWDTRGAGGGPRCIPDGGIMRSNGIFWVTGGGSTVVSSFVGVRCMGITRLLGDGGCVEDKSDISSNVSNSEEDNEAED